jgi:hypothetical protein
MLEAHRTPRAMPTHRALEVYEQLKQLTESQFDEVVLRVRATEAHLPGKTGEPSARALALVRMMGDDLDALERAIQTSRARPPDAAASPPPVAPSDHTRHGHALVSALLRVPVASSFQGRSVLLLGIPAAPSLARDENNARVDLMLIVSGLQMVDAASVDALIRNAIMLVGPETALARELEALRDASTRPNKVT